MKTTLILFALLSLTACGTKFGLGIEVPIGDNATLGVSTDTSGNTEVDLTAVIKP